MTLMYPPKVLTDIYFLWARTIDPLLYSSEMWWQAMEWVNMFFLMPFSAIAIVGFVRGWNWMRTPSIIISSWTIYSLILCLAATLWGDNRTPDVPMFLAVYVPFLILPMCVIWRMWHDKPFNVEVIVSRNVVLTLLVWLTMLCTFFVYFYYIGIWLRRYTPYLDVLDGFLPPVSPGVQAQADGRHAGHNEL
jgi:hypothetical protein